MAYEWQYIEDVIRATERDLDDAIWDDLDTTYLEIKLNNLRAAKSMVEKYATSW